MSPTTAVPWRSGWWLLCFSLHCTLPERQPYRCLEAPTIPGQPAAYVGKTTITEQRLLQRIRSQGHSKRSYDTEPVMRELLEDEIRMELLAQAAMDRGFARDPEVIDAARRVMVRKLLQRDLGPEVMDGIANESALRSYYERNKGTYMQPEKRRIAQIQLAPTEEGRSLAAEIIERCGTRPSDSIFQSFAQRYSKDPSNQRKGVEQPFVTQEELEEEMGITFAEQAFALEQGEISKQPVASTKGWHVVRVVARREALQRGFEDVREQLRERLLHGERSEQFKRYLKELQENYPVQVFSEQIQQMMLHWSGKQ